LETKDRFLKGKQKLEQRVDRGGQNTAPSVYRVRVIRGSWSPRNKFSRMERPFC
jgi:hypothetical protein